MINKILNDYKEIFSFRKNYLKYFRKRSNILSVFIVALSSAVIIACSYIFKISWPLMFIGGTPLFIFPIIKKEIEL